MSGMTDQEAMNTIDAYLPRHCRAALEHIAARLRGDGEQGKVVAWASPEGMERLRTQDDSATVVPEAFRDSRHTIPLYDRPQPAAVDEAMVERALNAYFADQCQLVDKESKLFRAMKAALTAALATQHGDNT